MALYKGGRHMEQQRLLATGSGAYSDEMIHDLIGEGRLAMPCLERYVQPSSIDLPLDLNEIYRVEGSFRPQYGESVRQLLQNIHHVRYDARFPLERRVTYIIKVVPKLRLYDNLYAYGNPKSTSGRNALVTELLADGSEMYNHVPEGYSGELYVAVMPECYPVYLSEAEPLSQVRILNGDSRLSREQLSSIFDQYQLIWQADKGGDGSDEISRHPISFEQLSNQGRIDKKGAVILTLYIRDDGFAGWRWKGCRRPVNLADRGLDPRDHWEPVYADSLGQIHVREDDYCIFSTNEYVVTPPELCWELKDVDMRFGSVKMHNAGFGDPGFGWFPGQSMQGNRITLEVSAPRNAYIRRNNALCSMRFEQVLRLPAKPYAGNYERQNLPQLPKQFAAFPSAV